MRKALYLLLTLGFVSQINAQVIFYVETPAPLVGNKEMTWADPAGGWGTPDMNIPANAILDTLAFAYDASAGDSLCCGAVINGSQIAGKIAVLYRGTCEFGVKALRAQTAGAIGVVVINNVPGSPIDMGAGAQGVNVTIPVAMITAADGAALKAQIDAGNVTAFFGSKFGFYENDLGMWPKDYINAPASSNPSKTNEIAAEFTVAAGAWIFNFGQNDQTGVRLKADITYGGGSVYSQTSSAASLASGDSMWVQLPNFNQATYNTGLYKFKYTILSDSIDDFPADDSRRSDFTISDAMFAYAQIDTVTLRPITNASYRPGGSTNDFEVCLSYRDSVASRLAATGIYFSATTPATDSLTGAYLEATVYEWNDVFTDVTGTVTLDNLNAVIYGGYTYPSNQQNEVVWAPFSAPLILVDNQRYLFCIKAFAANPNIFIGFGTAIDYDEHINTYLQPVSPINDNGTWYWKGFGTDVVPSLGVKMFDKLTLGDEEVTTINNGKPAYPNPATNLVNIPMENITGDLTITIMDMQGKLIKTEVRTVTTSGSLPINIEGVSNGQYVINVTTQAGASQSFKILINH